MSTQTIESKRDLDFKEGTEAKVSNYFKQKA
jgi:hypothetical protein